MQQLTFRSICKIIFLFLCPFSHVIVLVQDMHHVHTPPPPPSIVYTGEPASFKYKVCLLYLFLHHSTVPRSSISISLRVTLLAPLVELVVVLLGSGDVGDDDNVESAGGIAGSSVGVAAGVVGVLALRAALPGHLVDVDGGLGGGTSGGSA